MNVKVNMRTNMAAILVLALAIITGTFWAAATDPVYAGSKVDGMEITVVDDSNLNEIEDYVYKRVYDESLIYYGKQKYVDDLDVELKLHVNIKAASEKECKSLNRQAEDAIRAGEQRGLEDAEKASNAFEISISDCDYRLITDKSKKQGILFLKHI